MHYILQEVLITLGHSDNALVVTERATVRSFTDFLLERQQSDEYQEETCNLLPITWDRLMNIVNQQKAAVIYYTLATNAIHYWLVVPQKGLLANIHFRPIF